MAEVYRPIYIDLRLTVEEAEWLHDMLPDGESCELLRESLHDAVEHLRPWNTSPPAWSALVVGLSTVKGSDADADADPA